MTWKIQEGLDKHGQFGFYVVGDTGQPIWSDGLMDGGICSREHAVLIAAAPETKAQRDELLKAAKRAQREIISLVEAAVSRMEEHGIECDPAERTYSVVLDQSGIKAAIAAAEGTKS